MRRVSVCSRPRCYLHFLIFQRQRGADPLQISSLLLVLLRREHGAGVGVVLGGRAVPLVPRARHRQPLPRLLRQHPLHAANIMTKLLPLTPYD